MHVKISQGNKKMGQIPSVSLPAGITCRQDCECIQKCYARKIERLRPNVYKAYISNYNLLNKDPETYWREVEASVMMSRFFRFHVSGDIPNLLYLLHMVDIAIHNQHCEILCFTKRYDLVNAYLARNPELPGNLHIIFSAWKNLEMYNPHNLPEAHVIYKDGTTTAGKHAKLCLGNCTSCASTSDGCWTLKHGEQIVFKEH